MSGALLKVGIGAFFVFASAQMGSLAADLLERTRESVQATELLTLEGQVAVWTIEQKRTHAPRDQAEFERVLKQALAAKGGRDVTRDRWGEPYVYDKIHDRVPEWRISSKGRDRKLGTADDLVVHRREDQVEINRKPNEIMEQAIAALQRRDRQRLERLEALTRAPQPGVFAQGEAPPSDAAARERELRRQLDALLAQPLAPPKRGEGAGPKKG